MDVRDRFGSFVARPKRHLASVDAVENVPFDPWGGLIAARDAVCRRLHEFGKCVPSLAFIGIFLPVLEDRVADLDTVRTYIHRRLPLSVRRRRNQRTRFILFLGTK